MRYETQKRQKKGMPGVILALEPGLGKTVITLSIVNDYTPGALIVVPNQMVTSWGEQQGKFFDTPKVELITGQTSEEKTKKLNETERPLRVVNVEYLRTQSETRLAALNKNPEQIIVLDESQFISRTGTLQSDIANKLKGSFKILVSATPFSDVPNIRAIMKFLSGGEKRFEDGRTFTKLYDKSDPDSLRLLHFLFSDYIIRIKKRHVFKTYSQDEEHFQKEKDRLPLKLPQEIREFELTDYQAQEDLEIYTNWYPWQENQQRRVPLSSKDRQFAKRKRSKKQGEYFFSKRHSILQNHNSPKYTGSRRNSPKHLGMEKLVEELVKSKKKFIIFSSYIEEVKEFMRRYSKYGVVSFYSLTPNEFSTKGGYLADKNGNLRRFKMKNTYEYAIENGNLVDDPQGQPIDPMDYNRYRFQNDPNIFGFLATEESGGVGITLTAADVVIDGDLSVDYTREFQKHERANRIDNARKKMNQRFIKFAAKYPSIFIERTKKVWEIINPLINERDFVNEKDMLELQKENPELTIHNVYDYYFKNGTLSQIQIRRLLAQKRLFELLLDGIPVPKGMDLFAEAGLKNKVPFIFENGGQSISTDHAMLGPSPTVSLPQEDPLGGIDLNPKAIDWNVDSHHEESVWQLMPEEYDEFNIPGLTPNIISIAPIENLPLLLGIIQPIENTQVSRI